MLGRLAPAPTDRAVKPAAANRTSRPQSSPWSLVLVLLVVAAAALVVEFVSFRTGSVVLGGALAFAFGLRLVLPERDAGMLAVRSRLFDLMVLGMLAGSVLMFAFWVPAPS